MGRTARRLRGAGFVAVCGALLAQACATSRFAAHLPAALPDISAWQRSEGSVELASPRRRFDYRVYINPARSSVYSVTRLRITETDPAERLTPDRRNHELLQWDADGRDVRRYECVPADGGPACLWRELKKGGPEYLEMMPTLLQLYSIHAALLRERERQAAGR